MSLGDEEAFDQQRRAARWLASFVGPSEAVQCASLVDLDALAARAEKHNPRCVQQIDTDLSRSGCRNKTEQRTLRRVLLSWLGLNASVGYTQGFNFVAMLLLRTFSNGRVQAPAHMAAAAMSAMLRINIGLTPLGVEDNLPLQYGQAIAEEIVREVASASPFMQVLGKAMDVLTVLVLKTFPVLFVDFWSERSLPLVLDFIVEDFSSAHIVSCVIAARRCRHLLSASLLSHRRLFVFNKDVRQSLVIYESCCSLATRAQAAEIVELARHLERVEALGGAAM